MSSVGEQSSQAMNANSVRHMLARDPRAKLCQGMSMEEKRLEGTREE
jgi:hypothetical protein